MCHRRHAWGFTLLYKIPSPACTSLPFDLSLLTLIPFFIATEYTLCLRFFVLLGDIAAIRELEELSWYLHTDKRAHYPTTKSQRDPAIKLSIKLPLCQSFSPSLISTSSYP